MFPEQNNQPIDWSALQMKPTSMPPPQTPQQIQWNALQMKATPPPATFNAPVTTLSNHPPQTQTTQTQPQPQAQSQPQPQGNVAPPHPTGVSDATFLGSLNAMQQSFDVNNGLLQQRSALLQQLYLAPGSLTPQQMSALPADTQQLIQSGNIPLMQVQLAAINDQIAGRTNSLANSIQYLTSGYQAAEKSQNDTYATVLNYAKALNQKPSDIMKALAPSLMSQMAPSQLAALDNLAAPLLTSTQQPNPGATGSPLITMNDGTIGSKTNNVLGITYTPYMASLGATDSGIQKQDGSGQDFASFPTAQDSLNAGITLLNGPLYANLSVADAVKKWRGPDTWTDTKGNQHTAYGSEITQLPQDAKISSLSDDQKQQLLYDIANNGERIATVQAGAAVAVPTLAGGATQEQVDKALVSGPPIYSQGKPVTQAAVTDAAYLSLLGVPATNNTLLGGLGSAAVRTAVANKKSDIETAYGISPLQGASIAAEFKALSAANVKMVNTALYTKTFSATAKDNLDLAIQASQNIAPTGAKAVNHYVQWLQGNYTPAGPLAQLETYIYTASREYAKVTSGGVGSVAQLTDSANAKVDSLLSAAQSPEVLTQTAQAMKNDMDNVVNEQASSVNSFAPNVGTLLFPGQGFSVGADTGAATSSPPGTGGQSSANPKDPLGIL